MNKCIGDYCPKVTLYIGKCLPCHNAESGFGKPSLVMTGLNGNCHRCAQISLAILDGVPPFDLHVKTAVAVVHHHDAHKLLPIEANIRHELEEILKIKERTEKKDAIKVPIKVQGDTMDLNNTPVSEYAQLNLSWETPEEGQRKAQVGVHTGIVTKHPRKGGSIWVAEVHVDGKYLVWRGEYHAGAFRWPVHRTALHRADHPPVPQDTRLPPAGPVAIRLATKVKENP